MIPLGLKETKELEVEEVFRELIESHYYEDGADYDEALAELADLRQAMRTPTRDKNGTALLFQYYNQLYFVERRFFPPDRSSGLFFEWWVHEQFQWESSRYPTQVRLSHGGSLHSEDCGL